MFEILMMGICIILFHTVSESVSSYLAAYTCEIFAHDMRMGYVRYYLQSDIRMLSKLNVGEEQSAMQNELKDISNYLNENLFSFMKQFVAFVVTVIFLLCESRKQINGLADILLELFPIIQVYDACRLIHNVLNERLLEWKNANIRKERVAAKLMSFSGLLSFIPLLLLLGFGGCMVIKEEISLGVFYIFINLSGNVSGFLQNMPNIYAGFRRFAASVGRLESKLVLKGS